MRFFLLGWLFACMPVIGWAQPDPDIICNSEASEGYYQLDLWVVPERSDRLLVMAETFTSGALDDGSSWSDMGVAIHDPAFSPEEERYKSFLKFDSALQSGVSYMVPHDFEDRMEFDADIVRNSGSEPETYQVVCRVKPSGPLEPSLRAPAAVPGAGGHGL